MRMKIITTFVYPTVSYGCETWTLRESDKNILDTWWMKLMRRVRGVTKCHRLRSARILNDLNAKKLSDMVRERRMRYLGHVYRYPEQRLVRIALSATKIGQTKKGKKDNWRKQMINELQSLDINIQDANDKDEWKRIMNEKF